MREPHLSEEELARFQDGELPRAAGHLEWCEECNGRLRDLQAAITAFAEYRKAIRDPKLPPAPRPWRSLAALHGESEPGRSWRWFQIPVWATAVCLVVATVMILRHPAERTIPTANDLLAQAAAAHLPANRMIAMRLRGRNLVRPAVLTSAGFPEEDADLKRLAGLFVRARYSWSEPLSARSYQSWRNGLSARRDKVSVIHAGGPAQSYRVRTETEAGVLRSASLTLRGGDLRPVSGSFEFEGEAPLEMDEADGPQPEAAPGPVPASRKPPPEIPASPADTLHVLAALNRIGADAGDPIAVSDDGRHVLVTATGLSAERRQQVAAVLQGLPRVKLDLDAAPSSVLSASRPTPTERDSTGMPAPLRRQFEEKLGGPIALQEITDRVIEAAGSAVSAAHALDVLARRFPPVVETALAQPDRQLLHELRQRHTSTLRSLAAQIRGELKPLLPPSASDRGPSQEQDLFSTVGRIDGALNRLLAGSYTQPAGEAMLNLLAHELDLLTRQLEMMQ